MAFDKICQIKRYNRWGLQPRVWNVLLSSWKTVSKSKEYKAKGSVGAVTISRGKPVLLITHGWAQSL